MNLPILARFLADVRLEDIECGEQILDRLNQVVLSPAEKFNIKQTGYELLDHYKLMNPAQQRVIEDTKLVETAQWPNITRQIDYLSQADRTPPQSGLSFRQVIFVALSIIMSITIVLTMGGYYVLLREYGDRNVSHVFNIVAYIVDVIQHYTSPPE